MTRRGSHPLILLLVLAMLLPAFPARAQAPKPHSPKKAGILSACLPGLGQVAWYGLNIVDAVVDGHLYSYDVSDDLSLSIDPVFSLPEAPGLCYAGGRQTGLALTLNF